MEQQPPPTPYRRLYLATAWICIVGIVVTLAATGLEVFYFTGVEHLEIAGLGLLCATPLAVVWLLSFLGRYRFLPTLAALVAAIAGGGLCLLAFGSWFHEVGQVIFTGTSSYRGAGNWRGVEFFYVAIMECAFGLPGFLLLYGLGWLICLVKNTS